jgi:hypothetical protein
VAQLGAGAGAGDGVAAAVAGAAFGARLAADFFFAGGLPALAFLADFLADFFGAAALDFLADFFADLAFFAIFLVDLFEDFFADFFFAVTVLFLPFFAFLPAFFFLPLAIVILLLPPINAYRASQVVRLTHEAHGSIRSWSRTACRPIEKLNRVHYGNGRTAGDLHHASNVARGNHVRPYRRNVGNLSVAQFVRNVRLENVVGPRRTATQMALRHIFHHESVLGKQFFRSLRYFLSVLQRTCRMICDDDAARLLRRLQRHALDVLRYILGHCRNFRRRRREIAIRT